MASASDAAATEALTEMDDGPAKAAAVSATSKKLQHERMKNVQLVVSSAASSIKWAQAPTGEEEEEWQKLSASLLAALASSSGRLHAHHSRLLSFVCSVKEHVLFFSRTDWLDDVLQAVRSLEEDSKQEEAAAAAAMAGDAGTSSVTGSERPRKKPRSTADEALIVFRDVMTDPRMRNLPQTPEEFFKHLALSDEQIAAIIMQLPASSAPLSFLLLFGLEKAELEAAGLQPVQIRAWQNASSKLI